jgi:hypothetical protein
VGGLGLIPAQPLFSRSRRSTHTMNKTFTVAAVVIFAIVALMHLLRFVLGWDANIAGTEIPMWVSVAALVIAGGLAIGLWRENT